MIEVITVMAIVGLLTSAAIPAFNSMSGAQGFTRGVYEAEGLLEFARSEAIARQTYVWVAFQNFQTPAGSEIRMAAVASKDGSGTNTDPTNLAACSRLLFIRDAQLSEWTGLKSKTQSLLTGTAPVSVATNTLGLPFSSGHTAFDSGYTITFTPRGEALLKGAAGSMDGYDSLIDVSFRKARGTVVTADAEDASVVIQGSTGTARTLRL